MKNLKKWVMNPWAMLPTCIASIYIASFVLSAMPKEAWYSFPTVFLVVIGGIAILVWTIFLIVGIIDEDDFK